MPSSRLSSLTPRKAVAIDVSTPPGDPPAPPSRYTLELHTRLRGTEEMLADQYSLFHNLYARESKWFNTLSVLIIVCSSLMTFLGALDFLTPDYMRDNGYDRIPSLVLSFLTTLICSVMKFFDFQSKLTDTQEGAQRTQAQMRNTEVAREKLETWMLSDVEIAPETLEQLELVLSTAIKNYHNNRQLLLKLPPELILSFEKQHQMRALRRQKRQISRDMSRMFQKTIEHTKRAVCLRASDETLAARLEELISIHKQLLAQHGTIMKYTSNFAATVESERVTRMSCSQRVRWLCWLTWCRATCCRPAEAVV